MNPLGWHLAVCVLCVRLTHRTVPRGLHVFSDKVPGFSLVLSIEARLLVGTQDLPFFMPFVLIMRMCVRVHVKVCRQLLGGCRLWSPSSRGFREEQY